MGYCMEILTGIICYGVFFVGIIVSGCLDEGNRARRRAFNRAMWHADRRNLRAFEAKWDRDRGDRLRRLKRTNWLAALRARPIKRDVHVFKIRQDIPKRWLTKNTP